MTTTIILMADLCEPIEKSVDTADYDDLASDHMSYTLGELKDRVMVIEAGEVCISSISALKKTVTLTVDRWAIFIAALMEIHEEARSLTRRLTQLLIANTSETDITYQ